jgi:hypothetical protein
MASDATKPATTREHCNRATVTMMADGRRRQNAEYDEQRIGISAPTTVIVNND